MIWDHIKYFHAGEKWGPASGINGLLIMLLDKIRECWPDSSFVIHCGFESDGHAKDSQHKTGNAVDFHVQCAMSFAAQIERLEKILKELQVFNRVGLGIYPTWNNPGFHLDVRGSFARWGRIGDTYVGYADIIEYVKRQVVEKENA